MTRRFDLAGHLFVLLTVLFTVYGQLVLKWQIDRAGPAPEAGADKLLFLLRQLANPWILSSFVAAFLAALAWMAAMTKLPLNYAYPFMSLAFVLVLVFSVVFLGETVTWGRFIGTLLVMAGLVVIARA